MAEEPADLIVTGATIHAVDDSNPAPQAFAVRSGRFIFVGSTEGAMALRTFT
jgi:predicted amidohydrolase YtcJ